MPEATEMNSVDPADLAENGNALPGQAEEAAAAPSSAPGLTLAEVQAAIAQALAETRKGFDRTLQSQLDKRDAGLRKQIDSLRTQATQFVDAAKANGIEEAQAKQLGQAYFNSQLETLMAEEPKPNGKKGQRQADPDGETEPPDEQTQVAAYQQYVTQQGDRLREAYGLDYTDPEMRTLVTDRDEQAYFDSIKAAGKAKAARLAKQASSGQPARTPGLGPDGGRATRNPIADITDPDELYKLAAKQLRQR